MTETINPEFVTCCVCGATAVIDKPSEGERMILPRGWYSDGESEWCFACLR